MKFRYQSEATGLVMTQGHRVSGVDIQSSGGITTTLDADAVILASGGFQGNPAMMRAQFGPEGETVKLISPGTHFDTGDGIRVAVDQGATVSGDWNGMHIEPVDPRSGHSAPVVLVYPYGIVVDQEGRRFFDEGRDLVHETWEVFARDIHFGRPGNIAYAILDSSLFDIPGYARAIRSDVPPYQSESIEALAAQIEIPRPQSADDNRCIQCRRYGDAARFDATRCDGLAAAETLQPPKSNWARAIVKPPYLAYPLVGAIAYTFGGLATNAQAEVLGEQGPLPGLTRRAKPPGIFTAPRRMQSRCCAR